LGRHDLRGRHAKPLTSVEAKVPPAMQLGENCVFTAIASRSLDKVKAAAANLRVPLPAPACLASQ
jgi:hypothetical protein